MNIAQDTLKDKTLDLVESITPVKNLLETARAEREENPYKDVDQFFANLRFGSVKSETDYWTNLIPQDDSEMFARWVFAIMSVHTTWESNVRGYEVAMSDLSWTISKDKLKQMIVKAKVGLYGELTLDAHRLPQSPVVLSGFPLTFDLHGDGSFFKELFLRVAVEGPHALHHVCERGRVVRLEHGDVHLFVERDDPCGSLVGLLVADVCS